MVQRLTLTCSNNATWQGQIAAQILKMENTYLCTYISFFWQRPLRLSKSNTTSFPMLRQMREQKAGKRTQPNFTMRCWISKCTYSIAFRMPELKCMQKMGPRPYMYSHGLHICSFLSCLFLLSLFAPMPALSSISHLRQQGGIEDHVSTTSTTLSLRFFSNGGLGTCLPLSLRKSTTQNPRAQSECGPPVAEVHLASWDHERSMATKR